MKMKSAAVVLSLIALMGWGFAQEIKPVAVSPGSERGVARVSERCPTFSWSAVNWAAGYRVAVFEAKTAEVKSYESLALAAVPILNQDIQGKALSWTPSEGAGLKDGGLYVWYVQARDASGNGLWSAGKTFQVAIDKPQVVGVEERVTKRLRQRGVAGDVISEVAQDIRSGAKATTISKDFTLKGTVQEPAGIQAGDGGPGVGTLGNEGDARDNTYYGTNAGAALAASTGQLNAIFGKDAGDVVNTGSRNAFFGISAGGTVTGATNNAFFGYLAGGGTTGSWNTMLGSQAGWAHTSGTYNTFVGYLAGSAVQTGDNNVYIGVDAGQHNTDGNDNTMVGYGAGTEATAGSSNTFLGMFAGSNSSTGSNNTLLGYRAGQNNGSATQNTHVGYDAGRYNTASYCTSLGYRAGYNNAASYNVFLGRSTGYSNTSGASNTFVGAGAGYDNLIGANNTIVGCDAGANMLASFNSYLGYRAGYSTTSGYYNSFLGYQAGHSNTTGDYNTAIGSNAGYSCLSGLRNVFLGYAAGYAETGSDKLYISNSSGTFPLIYGDFNLNRVAVNGYLGVGVQIANYRIHVAGGAYCDGTTWTNASSRSLKENIRALGTEDAQEALAQLAPIRFNYKTDSTEECLGFIAEDVPSLVATGDRKGLSPMDIVAVLTKVVQEQQKMNEEQQRTIDELRKEIEALKQKGK